MLINFGANLQTHYQLILNTGIQSLIQTGWTPLLDASEEGHVEVVEQLIKHGAQLDIKNRVRMLLKQLNSIAVIIRVSPFLA